MLLWTDKVHITVFAPEHNSDGYLIDEIGRDALDPVRVATRGHELGQYRLVETGTDTGVFSGAVTLTGFAYDADSNEQTGDENGHDANPRTGDFAGGGRDGLGPTDGFLQSGDDDVITVSFESSGDKPVFSSALIQWNIGEVTWLDAGHLTGGKGVLQVVDPDMNLNPESVDSFGVDVWSDSDSGGIDLIVTETGEATGIFEGTVFFTAVDKSYGHVLRVSEGDAVTGEYEDNTLPGPYTAADGLSIFATMTGAIVPSLEGARLFEPFDSLEAWIEKGEVDWRVGPPKEGGHPPGHSAAANTVAKADNCDSECRLVLSDGLDLTGYDSAVMTLYRYVDDDLDGGEYLRVDVSDDGGASWTSAYDWQGGRDDDDTWIRHTLDLADHLASSDFKVRLAAKASLSSEDMMIDTLIIDGVVSGRTAAASVGFGEGSGSSQACAETNDCFVPETVTIDAGRKVVWVNSDTTHHTVYSGTFKDLRPGTVIG